MYDFSKQSELHREYKAVLPEINADSNYAAFNKAFDNPPP